MQENLASVPDVSAADDGKKYFTLDEAAQKLRMCSKTLRQILNRHPHCARIGKKKFVISADDIDRIYESLKAENPVPSQRSVDMPSRDAVYRRLAELTQPNRKKR